MRILPAVACTGLLVTGCTASDPNQPTQFARLVPPPAPPPTATAFRQPFTEIGAQETITAHVAADDPRCSGWSEWPCQFFRVTPSNDGTLDVQLTYGAGNLDLSFEDIEGRQFWYPISVPVSAGRTYQITIWEYESPGVEFRLRASLRPD